MARTENVSRIRISIAFSILMMSLFGLAISLMQIQIFSHGALAAQGTKGHMRTVPLPGERGDIFTRKGTPLTRTGVGAHVCVNPQLIKNPDEAARMLSRILGVKYYETFKKLMSRKTKNGKLKKYVCIKRNVDEETVAKIKSLPLYKTKAVFFENTQKRVYPRGPLAGQLLGFVSSENEGQEGLEGYFDSVLRGKDGKKEVEVDRKRRPVPNGFSRTTEAKKDGSDIFLTIDEAIQAGTEAVLAVVHEKYSAKISSAIVMKVKTGEILSMATYPPFDPNYRPDPTRDRHRLNHTVSTMYEPGSTMKCVTAAIMLDLGLVNDSDTTYCSGSMQIRARKIRCWVYPKAHETVSLAEGFMDSCNMAMVGLGREVEYETLHRRLLKFGLTKKTGIRCPGDRSGLLDPASKWSEVKFANLWFGQGIGVTQIQLITAVNALANGGVLMRPILIKEIRDKKGKLIERSEPQEVGRVVSSETADKVRDMMKLVVTAGTGKAARVPGLEVAGKTGTAQKVPYAEGKLVASFVGWMPADDPEVSMLIVVDEPQGVKFGGGLAAEAFRELATEVKLHLNLGQATVLRFPE